jgi:hypothetical protein
MWLAESGTWLQSVSLEERRLSGEPVSLGVTATVAPLDNTPVAVIATNGDVVLISALHDGRVVLARGSEEPARRLAPKVLLPAQENKLFELAAAADGTGFAVLLVHGEPDRNPRDPQRSQLDVELHVFDALGHARRPAVRWKTDEASSPQLAVCHGVYHAVWFGKRGVTATRLSSALGDRTEYDLAALPGAPTNLAPLQCADDVHVYASVIDDPFESMDVAPKLLHTKLSAGGAPAWQTIALPAAPFPSYERLDMIERGDHYELMVQDDDSARFVAISGFETAQPTQRPALPNFAHCIPDSDNQQVACLTTRMREVPQPTCKELTWDIDLAFYGESQSTETQARSRSDVAFATGAAIPNPDAPAHWQVAEEQQRLRCTAPEFQPLREAIARWCSTPEMQASQEDNSYAAYCDPQDPQSLLAWATSCNSEPERCGPPPLSNIPSVDREEFEAGERVEFARMNCSVWLSRTESPDQKTWEVVDRECGGD